MESTDEFFTLRCIIQPVNGSGTAKIRHEDPEVQGDVTFYKSKLSNDGKITRGEKIPSVKTSFREVLAGDNTILFVEYDTTKAVAPSGFGEGAYGKSSSGNPVQAGGGVGQGGSIDANGTIHGGSGHGGDLRGLDVDGKAGGGIGGRVYVPAGDSRAAELHGNTSGRIIEQIYIRITKLPSIRRLTLVSYELKGVYPKQGYPILALNRLLERYTVLRLLCEMVRAAAAAFPRVP
ncbi:hypothetical protein O1611_g1618 [Lasiodiplodia mahajangana]|uniref:Uncharacterized protein n=1 Tax=Lasiodiplodia mahajangana TaxID=1108764 RepID=A0ACC2JX48_9PEZI|nr:hypothetical protein O1611_g1618 [Lasiodiplodia mahajangana]